MASIYDLLMAYHAMHIQWLVELQNGLSSSEAEHSFSRLKEAFKLHTEFENEVFYPTLRAAPGAGQVRETLEILVWESLLEGFGLRPVLASYS